MTRVREGNRPACKESGDPWDARVSPRGLVPPTMPLWGTRSRRSKVPAILATVLVIAIAGLVAMPTLPTASASLASTGSVSTLPRSYGNVTTVSFQGHSSHGAYSGNATYGFVVNVTETNTSANVTEYSVQETIGIAFVLTFCRPNCSAPNLTLQVRYVSWEYRDAWANATDQASVTESANGTTAVVSAVGLLNASVRTHGRATGSLSASVGRPPSTANTPTVYQITTSSSYGDNSTVSFVPAVGLFPTGPLSSGETWSATSAFVLNADWSAEWSVVSSGPRGSFSFNGTGGRTIGPVPGSVTLNGSVEPSYEDENATHGLRVDYHLNSAQMVFLGPVFVRAKLPDAWGSGFGGDWDAMNPVIAQVNAGPDQLEPGAGWHDRIEASSFVFATTFSDTTQLSGSNEDGVATTTVSGAPMSSTEAASTSACLESGSCPSASPVGPDSGLTPMAPTLALVGILAVGLLAAVVVLSRRGKGGP